MEDKIKEAMEVLKKSILSEMNKLTENHMKTIKKMERLQTAINEAGEILHDMPHTSYEIDREIEKAWDILDGVSRIDS